MLKIRTGKTFFELEQDLVNYLAESHKTNPSRKMLVVTPSKHVLKYLQTIIPAKYNINCFNTHFHTFYSLAANICQSETELTAIQGSDLLKKQVVRKILEEMKLTNIMLTPGFVSAISATVEDLCQAGVEPQNLAEMYSETKTVIDGIQPDFNLIVEIYSKYKSVTDNLPVTIDDKLTLSATKHVPDSKFLHGFEEIVYYGFYDLNSIQNDFFQAVTEYCPVTLYIIRDKSNPALEFANDYYQNYLGKAMEVKEVGSYELIDEISDKKDSEAKASHYVKIINTTSATDEVWFVAKEIINLVENKKYNFNDIGVIARSLEPYASAVDEIFTENKIPFTTTGTRPILSYPLTKYCLQLLTLAKEEFSGDMVIDIVSSPYFHLTLPSPLHGEGLVKIIRERQIEYGYEQWINRLYRNTPEEKWLLKFINEIASEFKKMSSAAQWSELAEHSIALLEKYTDISIFDKESYLQEPRTKIPWLCNLERGETKIWNTIKDVINEFKQLDILKTQTSLEEYLDLLINRIEETTLSLGQDNISGVSVFDVMSARAMLFKTVFVIGLNEKFFPRIVREDPFLREGTRNKISATLGNKLPTKEADGYKEEKLLFYLATNSAEENLYLLNQRSDETGRAMVESNYLNEFKKHWKLEIVNCKLPRRLFEKLDTMDNSLLTAKELVLKSININSTINDSYKNLVTDYTWLNEMVSTQNKLDKIRKSTAHDGFTGELVEFNKHITTHGFSVSSLETYGKCPFQYFCTYVLDIGESEEPTDRSEIDPRTLGKLYHEILAEFYKKYTTSPCTSLPIQDKPSSVSAEDILRIVFKNTFDKYNCHELGLYPLLWETVKEEVEANVNDLIDDDITDFESTGYQPAFFEERVDDKLSPDIIGEKFDIKFTARFDRIDINNSLNTFRLIDYKLNPKDCTMETESLRGNKSLPIALYIPLCTTWLKNKVGKKLDIAYAGWYSLTRHDENRVELPSNFWKTYAADMMNTIKLYVSNILSGTYFIYEDDHCKYCIFSMICRKNYYPAKKRVEDDKSVEKYELIKSKKK